MTARTLLELVTEDLGQPARRRGDAEAWWRCPFHDDRKPSLQVDYFAKRDKWRYHCWGCNATGDAQDWLVRYRRLSSGDAWRIQNGSQRLSADAQASRPVTQTKASSSTSSADVCEPPAQAWQDVALDVVLECALALQLQQDAGARAAMHYLRSRGLRPKTLERFAIGYNSHWRKLPNGTKLAPGVVIPGLIGGSLWYVKVRVSDEDAKRYGQRYLFMTGSSAKVLYNAEALLRGASVAVALEGELDVALVSQFFADDELAAVTLGSAHAKPTTQWLSRFAFVDRLLIATDADKAGRDALAAWQKAVRFVERVEPPAGAAGKDATDFWREGHNLRSWLLPYVQNVAEGGK